jgi:cytochrome bd-type quinol oxidase subunit 2
MGDMSDTRSSRAIKAKNALSLVATGVCLFFGFWAFVYEGYTEDAGSKPVNSWPYGAALYAIAVVLVLGVIRRTRPEMSPAQVAIVALGLAVIAVFAALGSLDAGGHSFEF